MMDIRSYQIIDSLYGKQDYLDQEELSDILGVSTRTIRELMKNVREEINKHGALITYKNNLGYRMEIVDSRMFLTYIDEVHTSLNSLKYEYPITQKERCDYLIRKFLVSEQPLKSDDLCEELGVSKTTFAQDLKNVKEELKKYRLSLQTAFRKGLYLDGNESDIQRCTADYYFYNEYADSESFTEHTLGMFCKKYELTIRNTVRNVLDQNHYSMTDLGVNNLVIHILITLFRTEKGMDNGNQKTGSRDTSNCQLEMKMAEEIAEGTYKRTKISIEKEYLYFIAVHMMGSRLLTEKDENLISLNTLNLVRELLDKLNEQFHINFYEDLELFGLLCMHMEPMIQRVKNGIPLRNPLLQTIKTENPDGYDLAVYSCHWLTDRLNAQIDENEIGYLALHFGIALERLHTEKGKKILVVCASGAGTSRMLKYNLEKIFQNKAESIETASVSRVNEMNLEKYDLIVTTVPLHIKTETKIIQVNYILSCSDQSVLSHVFDDVNAEKIVSAFDRRLFIEKDKDCEPDALLQEMIEKLSSVTHVPDIFFEMTMKREKISSTYMGNGVAVPHPSLVLLDENYVVVAHLKNKMKWFDGNCVEWVFLLGMKKAEDSDTETLVHALYGMISNKEILKQMKDCDYGMFLSLFSSVYSSSNNDEFFQ